MKIHCKKIVGGKTQGVIAMSLQPINFLSMVDTKTGKITDPSHDLYGLSIKNAVLVFPNSKGSSVGAYSIYALRSNDATPLAMVCTNKVDVTTASGCAAVNIPLVEVKIPAEIIFRSGDNIILDADNGIIEINKTI